MKILGVAKALTVLVVLIASVAVPIGASAQDAGGGADGLAAPQGQEAPASLPTPPTEPLVRDVLAESMPGVEALAALSGDVLAVVAEQNGQSVEALTEALANDPALWLDEDGMMLFLDPPPPAEYITDEAPEPGPFPNSQTFFLNSRPGSSKTLYLDFNGYALPAGTAWRGGAAYNALPWDIDGNGANWSQAEHDTIQSVWQRVAEDYASFDVNVTTQDPGYAAINRSSTTDTVYGTRVVITDSPNSDFCNCGGVAFVGVFDNVGTSHDFYQPAWSFATGVGNGAHNLAEVSSHEAGHNIGLSHDGTTGGTEYYAGHGMWAPIMGNSYGQPVTQWSRGEYSGANNTEDDYAVAGSNGLALVADEAGCAIAATENLEQGVTKRIAAQGDCDAFRYIAPCTGTYVVDAQPAPTSPNLSLQMNLWNWGGAFISNSAVQPVRVNGDVASGMGETASLAMTAGASYTIAVFPLANGTASTGFTNFANRGQYSVRVSTPCGADQFGVSTIGGPFDTRSANSAAYTIESGEPNATCGDGVSRNSAWWSWTAPATGTVTFDTVGSNFDTVLAAYTGSTPGSLTQVGCNDDFGGLQSSLTLAVTGGTTYRIQVDGFGLATGNIVLNTRGCVPVNNNTFGCASTLSTGPVATGSNVGYNREGGEPVPGCGFNTGTTAWWNWTAPGTGSFTLNTTGSSFDTVLGVYTGSAVNALTAVTCNDDSGGLQSSVTFNATAGTTYRIQVSGYNQQTGTINLRAIDNRPFIRPFGTVVAEGDSGTSVANVVVYLETPSGTPYVTPTAITVNYATVDLPVAGIATSTSGDYVAAAGTLTFPAGSSQATVPITINGDTLDEPPALYGEWGVLTFNTPSNNARINTSAFFGLGIVIIIDEATDSD